eukprot:7071174-Prymnesium_polylepis.1
MQASAGCRPSLRRPRTCFVQNTASSVGRARKLDRPAGEITPRPGAVVSHLQPYAGHKKRVVED